MGLEKQALIELVVPSVSGRHLCVLWTCWVQLGLLEAESSLGVGWAIEPKGMNFCEASKWGKALIPSQDRVPAAWVWNTPVLIFQADQQLDIFPFLWATQWWADLLKDEPGVGSSCHRVAFLTLFAEPLGNVNQKLGLLFDFRFYGWKPF